MILDFKPANTIFSTLSIYLAEEGLTMKKQFKVKTILIVGTLVLLIIAFTPLTFASDTNAAANANAEKEVQKTEQDQTAEKRKEIMEEATSAVHETQNAIKALYEKKNKDALAALERATGKLEIILVREPELALAPQSVNAVTYNILADIDAIKTLRDEIEDALDDGRVQEARRLIRNLASETVISVSNIPLATYPNAIKQAVKQIDDGKIEEAKQVLQTALNTLVVTDTIIPLPVVAADNMLEEAKTLAEKSDRKEEENKRLDDLIKGARKKLEFAQALGYGSKKDFKNLYKQLDKIEDKTEGGKSGIGFFTKIKGYLKDTVISSQRKSESDQPG